MSSLLNRLRAVAPESGHPASQRNGPPSEADQAQLVEATRAALQDPATVDAQLRAGGEEGLSDAQIMRWLAARGWSPEKAAHDLSAHAAWRVALAPEGRVLESDVAGQLRQNKLMVQGLDLKGRGVALLVGGNHIPGPDQAEVQRFFCYAADAAIAMADPVLNPGGKVSFIIDVGNFGWRNFDVSGAKTLFKMIHAHYVERLATLYFHNASTVTMQLYKLVSPFIDPRTRERIVFLPHDPAVAAEVLSRDMDVRMLPRNLGGESEPIPVEDAWRRILADREAAAAAAAAKPQSEAAAPEGAEGLSGLSSDGGDLIVSITRRASSKASSALPALPAAEAAAAAVMA